MNKVFCSVLLMLLVGSHWHCSNEKKNNNTPPVSNDLNDGDELTHYPSDSTSFTSEDLLINSSAEPIAFERKIIPTGKVEVELEQVYANLSPNGGAQSPVAIGLKVVIINGTGEKIYIPHLKSLLSHVLIEKYESKDHVRNVTSDFLKLQVGIPKKINDVLGDTLFEINQDEQTRLLIDSLVKAIPTTKDNASYKSIINNQIMNTAQSILYLDKQAYWEQTYSLNALLSRKGRYTITFRFPPPIPQLVKELKAAGYRDYFDKNPIIFPLYIRGHKQWKGKMESRSLVITIQ